MFDLNGLTITVVEILDPVQYPGADLFNWFFTLLIVWGLFCFGIKTLVRILTRS